MSWDGFLICLQHALLSAAIFSLKGINLVGDQSIPFKIQPMHRDWLAPQQFQSGQFKMTQALKKQTHQTTQASGLNANAVVLSTKHKCQDG